MSFLFSSQLYCFEYVADVCFFSCHGIISHDRIYAFTDVLGSGRKNQLTDRKELMPRL